MGRGAAVNVWDDAEFLEAAKRRFLSGESPTIIARDMGMSRNKLKAKMDRMGLKRPVVTRAKAKGAFVLPPMRTDMNPAEKQADSLRKNAEARAASPDNPVRDHVFLLEDMEAHHCRWPCGDPAKPNFSYCGDERAHDKAVYCAKHLAKAYQGVPPKRLRA